MNDKGKEEYERRKYSEEQGSIDKDKQREK
jgi:hypothetical protein